MNDKIKEVMETLKNCCNDEIVTSKDALMQLLEGLKGHDAKVGYNTFQEDRPGYMYDFYTYQSIKIRCEGLFEILFDDPELEFNVFQVFYTLLDNGNVLIVSIYGDYKVEGEYNCINENFLVRK